jgi:hypothetical protein
MDSSSASIIRPRRISSISPDNAVAGLAPLFSTVNGSNFSSGATLLLDGSPGTAYPRSPTQLTTTLSASDLASARSIAFAVANPDPSAGPSNQMAFTINPFTSNPAPTLVSTSDAFMGYRIKKHAPQLNSLPSSLALNRDSRTGYFFVEGRIS